MSIDTIMMILGAALTLGCLVKIFGPMAVDHWRFERELKAATEQIKRGNREGNMEEFRAGLRRMERLLGLPWQGEDE